MAAAGKTMTVSDAVDRGLIERCRHAAALLAAAHERAAKPKPARAATGEPRNVTSPDVREHVQAALKRVEAEISNTEAARGVVGIIRAGLANGWKSASTPSVRP